MKEFLSSHGVEFDAKDVVGNPENLQQMMQATGGRRGVPAIVIGDEVVMGFNKDRISELLKISV